jgi:uncharacterized protein
VIYRFEWDPYKARQNVQKHKVSFERAAEVFKDALAISIYDDEHSHKEDRWITVGRDYSENTLVVVHTFVQEDDNASLIRIISARKATKSEIIQYEGDKP